MKLCNLTLTNNSTYFVFGFWRSEYTTDIRTRKGCNVTTHNLKMFIWDFGDQKETGNKWSETEREVKSLVGTFLLKNVAKVIHHEKKGEDTDRPTTIIIFDMFFSSSSFLPSSSSSLSRSSSSSKYFFPPSTRPSLNTDYSWGVAPPSASFLYYAIFILSQFFLSQWQHFLLLLLLPLGSSRPSLSPSHSEVMKEVVFVFLGYLLIQLWKFITL